VHVKALTAVEIAHLARIERTSVREVLLALKGAGLTTMPGGGAEVFSTAVRATIAENKLRGEEWIGVHREAHALGIPSNCTMLYGHIETARDRAEHLAMLRDLQDETGGFLTYIPLAYHAEHNALGEQMGWSGRATQGVDDLKNIAVGRLFLDNIPHVKAFWIATGVEVAQTALWFGVDDLDGTVQEEKIYHMAGARTPESMTTREIARLIAAAGREPVERDTLYNEVKSGHLVIGSS